ncbi:DoxX family protein [Salinisphaera aquimarina]|uniref:DoxX family protein n=1 Tax=Salinisphaera aquimarina TaxID=2094031 RepID=A0ABV7EP62_9GAMM
MNRYQADDLGKLVLRLVLALLLLAHGFAKITGGIDGVQAMLVGHGLPPELGYAVFIGEIVAPALLIAGLYSRFAAGVVVINMLVALWLAHTGQLLSLTPQGGWAVELQAFFLFTAAAIALMGSGNYALRAD